MDEVSSTVETGVALLPKCELVFLLDMTASMDPLKAEAVIGFNVFLAEQKAHPGEATITLIVFNSEETRTVYDRVDLAKAEPMSPAAYKPSGMTPLLDTIANGIKNTLEFRVQQSKIDRADKVIFAILTDGEENYRKKYNRKQVFEFIETQKSTGHWEFIFLGANQDAYMAGGQMGIDRKDTMTFQATGQGVRDAYAYASTSAVAYRSDSGELPKGGD